MTRNEEDKKEAAFKKLTKQEEARRLFEALKVGPLQISEIRNLTGLNDSRTETLLKNMIIVELIDFVPVKERYGETRSFFLTDMGLEMDALTAESPRPWKE